MGNLAITGGDRLRNEPFPSWPIVDEAVEGERLRSVLQSGKWSSDGPLEQEFEAKFAKRHGVSSAIAVSNGTVSIVLALRAIGIKPGDEVIVPALTWTATATAVLEVNAVPVLVDIDPESLCIDVEAVAAAITPRTVAVIPVHLYSAMPDMTALTALCQKHGLKIIEDCAHAHGAAFEGKSAGAIGDIGSFSFQSSKVMTSGEGGLLTTNSPELGNRLYSLKNCGRIVGDRGEVLLGGNHRLSEWQHAILLGQLERLDEQREVRERSIAILTERLLSVPGVSVQKCPVGVTSRPQYRLVLHYRKSEAGGIPIQQFVEAVCAEGVPLERTYGVIHQHPTYLVGQLSWYAQRLVRTRCPKAEEVQESVCTVPHQLLLGTPQDLESIAAAIEKVIRYSAEAASAKSRLKDGIKSVLRKIK
jgi:L-glutamine:2-deoxy-scyllo-inosose/3-amino-2,3-dideoxy-scyllo-inosose aminotransferase